MKHFTRAALGAVVVFAVSMGFVGSALAAPAPGFERFAGCPSDRADVLGCLRSETNGGHIQIGSKDVPINKQIVLSGGLLNDFQSIVYNSQGGLQAPPLKIPGGLVGLTGIPELIIDFITFGANEVYAKTELVGTPKATGFVALELPVRIKLQNPFLSGDCSIGSAANPVTLKLTTGTTAPPPPNKPITGTLGTLGPDPTNPLISIANNNTYVDNAFAAPAVTNCGLFKYGPINLLVNATSGLPAAAGRNTAVLSNTNVSLAAIENVYP